MAEIKTFMATLMREKADNSNGKARTPPPPRSGDPRNLSPRQDQPDQPWNQSHSHPLTPSVGTGMEINKQGLSVMGGSGFLGNLSEWEWN